MGDQFSRSEQFNALELKALKQASARVERIELVKGLINDYSSLREAVVALKHGDILKDDIVFSSEDDKPRFDDFLFDQAKKTVTSLLTYANGEYNYRNLNDFLRAQKQAVEAIDKYIDDLKTDDAPFSERLARLLPLAPEVEEARAGAYSEPSDLDCVQTSDID